MEIPPRHQPQLLFLPLSLPLSLSLSLLHTHLPFFEVMQAHKTYHHLPISSLVQIHNKHTKKTTPTRKEKKRKKKQKKNMKKEKEKDHKKCKGLVILS
jgi:hypothetical protein